MNEKEILVVEDDELNMILIVDILSLYTDKLKIDEALNGHEALKKLKVKDYDLIIMDIRMPELDGYETTRYIREKLPKPKNETPVLGLSAHVIEEEVEKGKLAGINDFLSKPINPEKLIEKIRKLTSKKSDNKIKPGLIKCKKETKHNNKLDIRFFEELFKNDRYKIYKTLLSYSKEIPIQLDNLIINLENEQFENIKLIAHSLKSTFKYIGREDLSEAAKQIEQMSLSKSNSNEIKTRIDYIVSNWKAIEQEIKKLLKKYL